MAERLPTPAYDDAAAWVDRHLSDLVTPGPASDIRGGQRAANAALAGFDVAGYSTARNEVWPAARRGASQLSPYVRHGLIDLPTLWNHVADGPARDRVKFRDELMWQEYARHLYARVGGATGEPLRHRYRTTPSASDPGTTWPGEAEMACVSQATSELRERGWLPNQARMWLASHWAVRHGWSLTAGEDEFFRHLLDGSRAANRLGWQWTAGTLTGRVYGFSRSQVERRAPGLCARCPVAEACPIEQWPDDPDLVPVDHSDPRLRRDADIGGTAGPTRPEIVGEPEAVWLTAESLGDADPALAAHPDLPAVFVFDAPLLARLRLARGRLVFLAETLADLAEHRDLELRLGDPVETVAGRRLAATFAPVPGWRTRAAQLDVVATHPWPWLVRPHVGSVTSFSAWRRSL